MTSTTKKLILKWQEAADQLSLLKETEKKLRLAVAEALGIEKQDVGLETYTVKGVGIVKLTKKESVSIDIAALDSIMSQMPEDYRQIGVLIDYDPKLIKTGYDSLNEEMKKFFDQALVKKPATPTLELIGEMPMPKKNTQPDFPIKPKKK